MLDKSLDSSEVVNRLANAIEKIYFKGIIISSAKQKLLFDCESEKWVYYLKSGSVNICRLSDDIVIHTVEAPAFLGVTSLFDQCYFHYLYTNIDSAIVRVSLRDFYNMVDESGLWRDVCWLVCSAAHFYYKRDELVYASKVYGVIKNHLELIWSMPEDVRAKLSIFDFILSRTGISRSSLNKVLKELLKGGYINVRRGRLVDMKKLPMKY